MCLWVKTVLLRDGTVKAARYLFVSSVKSKMAEVISDAADQRCSSYQITRKGRCDEQYTKAHDSCVKETSKSRTLKLKSGISEIVRTVLFSLRLLLPSRIASGWLNTRKNITYDGISRRQYVYHHLPFVHMPSLFHSIGFVLGVRGIYLPFDSSLIYQSFRLACLLHARIFR